LIAHGKLVALWHRRLSGPSASNRPAGATRENQGTSPFGTDEVLDRKRLVRRAMTAPASAFSDEVLVQSNSTDTYARTA
jgi:hypothetical protein